MKRSQLIQFDANAARDELARVQASLATIVPLARKLRKRATVLDMRQRELLVALWEYEHSHVTAPVGELTGIEIARLADRLAGITIRTHATVR